MSAGHSFFKKIHMYIVVNVPPPPAPSTQSTCPCLTLCVQYFWCTVILAFECMIEQPVCVFIFYCLFFSPPTLQYLNNSQDRNMCPEIQDAFNDLTTSFNDLTSGASGGIPSLNISGLRRRRQTGGTTQNVLNVGYVRECIVNQAFDFVRQYDVYRYVLQRVVLELHTGLCCFTVLTIGVSYTPSLMCSIFLPFPDTHLAS